MDWWSSLSTYTQVLLVIALIGSLATVGMFFVLLLHYFGKQLRIVVAVPCKVVTRFFRSILSWIKIRVAAMLMRFYSYICRWNREQALEEQKQRFISRLVEMHNEAIRQHGQGKLVEDGEERYDKLLKIRLYIAMEIRRWALFDAIDIIKEPVAFNLKDTSAKWQYGRGNDYHFFGYLERIDKEWPFSRYVGFSVNRIIPDVEGSDFNGDPIPPIVRWPDEVADGGPTTESGKVCPLSGVYVCTDHSGQKVTIKEGDVFPTCPSHEYPDTRWRLLYAND